MTLRTGSDAELRAIVVDIHAKAIAQGVRDMLADGLITRGQIDELVDGMTAIAAEGVDAQVADMRRVLDGVLAKVRDA